MRHEITAADLQLAPMVRDLCKQQLYSRDAAGTDHPVDMAAIRATILNTRPATNDDWWAVAASLEGLYANR